MGIINLSELEDKYKTWSNDDLIRAISLDKENYLPEALELMEVELSRRNIQVAEKDYISSNITLIDGIEAQKLNGITGFLLLFIIIFFFNIFISLISGISILYRTEFHGILLWYSFFNILIAFYGIYCLVILIGKKEIAIKHTQYCLAIGAIAATIFYFILSQDYKINILPILINSALWLTYLKYSKRVKYTYVTAPKDKLEDSSADENSYICSDCKSEVSEEDKVCPKCGADLTIIEEQ